MLHVNSKIGQILFTKVLHNPIVQSVSFIIRTNISHTSPRFEWQPHPQTNMTCEIQSGMGENICSFEEYVNMFEECVNKSVTATHQTYSIQ